MNRPCLDCGTPSPRTRCALCQRRSDVLRGSPTQRGYDSEWRKVRLVVLDRDDYLCRLRLLNCTVRATTVDHIVPLSRGGSRLDLSNLVAACLSCNSSKGNR